MKYRQLISQSKANLETNPPCTTGILSPRIFSIGAEWMFDKLHEGEKHTELHYDRSVHYLVYGVGKYGISLAAYVLAILCLVQINIVLIPLSIIVFYVVEVHFLFLFPILIDNIPRPIWTSIRQTYKVGLFASLVTVIPLGFFMVAGLFRLRNPLRNWYIGCLAIVIWYRDEIRNRI